MQHRSNAQWHRSLHARCCDPHKHAILPPGEDVGHYGGSYKCTYDLYKKYGEMRLLDTPICGAPRCCTLHALYCIASCAHVVPSTSPEHRKRGLVICCEVLR